MPNDYTNRPRGLQLDQEFEMAWTYISPAAGTLTLVVKPAVGFTLTSLLAGTDTGTVAVSIKKNGTTIVTSPTQPYSASSTSLAGAALSLGNTYIGPNDTLTVTLGAPSGSPTSLFFQLNGRRKKVQP